MARFTRTERTVTEIVHTLSLPANGIEVDEAIQAAARDYKNSFGYAYVSDIPSSALTITTDGANLVISFRVEEEK